MPTHPSQRDNFDRVFHAHSWHETPLGAVATWGEELRRWVKFILKATQPMLLLWGPEKVILFNEAHSRTLGSRFCDALGLPAAVFWTPIWNEMEPLLWDAYAGHSGWIQDKPLLTWESNYTRVRYFTVSYSPVESIEDDVLGALCIITDRTEVLSNNISLEQERAFLRELFERSTSFIAVLEGPEHIYTVSNAVCRGLFGTGDKIGRSIREAVPELIGQGIIEIFDHVYRTGETYVGEGLRLSLQDKNVFLDFTCQPMRRAGNIVGVMVEGYDVTSHHNAQERIRDVTERLELAVRTHSIGIFDTDPRRGVAQWSEEMERIYGYGPGQFKSTLAAYRHHVFPNDLARIGSMFAKTVEARAPELSYSFRIRRCDGQVRDIEASARFFYNDEGEHVRRVGVNIDVTERKAAERRLSETQAELIHLSRLNSLGAMASSLAHELNQPLTAVASYISATKRMLQRQRVVEVEPALEILQLASASALRAGELIKRLRVMSSKGAVAPQQVNLAELIRDTAALAMPDAATEGMVLNLSIGSDAHTAYADPVLLQQVFFNLLRNAAQAMSGTGGAITIRSAATSAHEIMVTIEDTGPGLDSEVAASLFTAFITTKPDGMGVGLSICRTIIEKSGGRIWADSGSSGTSFYFTLPRTASEFRDIPVS